MHYTNQIEFIEYQNTVFNSPLELTWYLFLCELNIQRNKVISQGFDYNQGIHHPPTLRFILKKREQEYEIFASVKPASKTDFKSELNLYDYIYGNRMICILGQSNSDYQFLKINKDLTAILDLKFKSSSSIWQVCHKKSTELAQIAYSKNKLSFLINNEGVSYQCASESLTNIAKYPPELIVKS